MGRRPILIQSLAQLSMGWFQAVPTCVHARLCFTNYNGGADLGPTTHPRAQDHSGNWSAWACQAHFLTQYRMDSIKPLKRGCIERSVLHEWYCIWSMLLALNKNKSCNCKNWRSSQLKGGVPELPNKTYFTVQQANIYTWKKWMK